MAKTIFYSLAALVRKILFCHSKIKFISSRHRVISSTSEVIIQRNRENNREKIKNCLLLLLAGSNVGYCLTTRTSSWLDYLLIIYPLNRVGRAVRVPLASSVKLAFRAHEKQKWIKQFQLQFYYLVGEAGDNNKVWVILDHFEILPGSCNDQRYFVWVLACAWPPGSAMLE